MGLLNFSDVGGLEGPFQNDLPFHSIGFVEVKLTGGGRLVGRRPIPVPGRSGIVVGHPEVVRQTQSESVVNRQRE